MAKTARNKCTGLLPVPKIMFPVALKKNPAFKSPEKADLFCHPICFFSNELFDDALCNAPGNRKNKTSIVIGVEAHAAGTFADADCVLDSSVFDHNLALHSRSYSRRLRRQSQFRLN